MRERTLIFPCSVFGLKYFWYFYAFFSIFKYTVRPHVITCDIYLGYTATSVICASTTSRKKRKTMSLLFNFKP